MIGKQLSVSCVPSCQLDDLASLRSLWFVRAYGLSSAIHWLDVLHALLIPDMACHYMQHFPALTMWCCCQPIPLAVRHTS